MPAPGPPAVLQGLTARVSEQPPDKACRSSLSKANVLFRSNLHLDIKLAHLPLTTFNAELHDCRMRILWKRCRTSLWRGRSIWTRCGRSLPSSASTPPAPSILARPTSQRYTVALFTLRWHVHGLHSCSLAQISLRIWRCLRAVLPSQVEVLCAVGRRPTVPHASGMVIEVCECLALSLQMNSEGQ